MMRQRLVAALVAAAALSGTAAAAPAGASQEFCGAIARAVDAAGAGPVMVRSYEAGPQEAALPPPLATSAFTYDNALAAIALVSCGDLARAQRIGDALLRALRHDRTFTDGRVRNAYRAGPVDAGPVALPGWWDAQAKRWDEDAYQDGTSTGNAAWAALAFLNLAAATGRADQRDGAVTLLHWIDRHAADGPGPAGYAGGLSGFDGAQQSLTWKSTEHNLDVAAAAAWGAALTGDAGLHAMAARARGFVGTRFQSVPGMFLLGTQPDGSDASTSSLALDVQLWPILAIDDPPTAWRRALGFADGHLRRGDGMTFAGIGVNRWTEGTAQAALAFRAAGADALAGTFLDGLSAHASPSGLLYATSAGEVDTGLAIEAPDGGSFRYFHRPHLGATAWAALARNRWNPFTGRRVAPRA